MLLLRRFHQHTENDVEAARSVVSKKNALVHFFREHTNARRVQRNGTVKMVIENFCARALVETGLETFTFYDNHALSETVAKPAGILTRKRKFITFFWFLFFAQSI